MASSIMDFLMLALVAGGGLFVYMNRECIMSATCFGNNQDVCATDPTAPGCPQDPCVLNPKAAGCGTGGTGGDDPSKCSSQYNGSCNGECGGGSSCTSSSCKNCMKACGSNKAPAGCRGGSQGSQCGTLCSNNQCVPHWNQCSSDCTKCPWISAAQSIITAARNTNSAYNIECGRYVNPVGVRCRACRTCPNGSKYCSERVLIAGRSASTVVNDMLSSWQRAHPSGCTTGGTGCTKTCPGGYVLNKSDCSCICNSSVKNCGSGSKCLLHTGTQCQCLDTNKSPCNGSSAQHTCRGSNGLCSCCNNSSGSNCPGKSGNCTWDCKNAYCWQSTAHDGKVYKVCTNPGQTTNRANGCSQARSLFCQVKGPCSSYTDTDMKQSVLAKYNPNSYRVRLA